MSTTTRKGHELRFIIMALYLALKMETAFARWGKRYVFDSGGDFSDYFGFWLIAVPPSIIVVLLCYYLCWFCFSRASKRPSTLDTPRSVKSKTEGVQAPCEAIVLISDPRQEPQS
ncbi:hypothetical protein RRG08_008597 [Elysia crispata]|uniref:Uncharacterized protein n=1 Tax=Elysia crispata TaxID=231223 RepID=A0AAE1B772_9GAST|nr:hypothetical protein RRG08_008597 [Elysia crispata]